MRHSRKAVTGGAVLAWAGVLTMIATTWAGDPGDADESRLFGFFLAAAITLTVSAMLASRVMDPRAAYRLGWDARGRHDEPRHAPVASLDEQRRA
jgi:hypothetical protein